MVSSLDAVSGSRTTGPDGRFSRSSAEVTLPLYQWRLSSMDGSAGFQLRTTASGPAWKMFAWPDGRDAAADAAPRQIPQ